MWKPMGASTGQCCTSLQSTGHHIMRGGLRPPTQQDCRRLRRRQTCWVSHYVVTCGFQRGAALASAIPHWFPHVRLNIPGWQPCIHGSQPSPPPAYATKSGTIPMATSTVPCFSLFVILLWGPQPKPPCGNDPERHSAPGRWNRTSPTSF